MCDNFIKIDRKILDWGWFNDDVTLKVWLFILVKANWKDAEFLGVTIHRGQMATSQESMADKLKLSRQQVRTALNHLKSTNELTIKKYPKFSVITVNNYEKYQGINQRTNQRPTNDQPTTNHNIRNKELKKERSIDTVAPKKYVNKFNNFEQRTYDFDELERSLINR